MAAIKADNCNAQESRVPDRYLDFISVWLGDVRRIVPSKGSCKAIIIIALSASIVFALLFSLFDYLSTRQAFWIRFIYYCVGMIRNIFYVAMFISTILVANFVYEIMRWRLYFAKGLHRSGPAHSMERFEDVNNWRYIITIITTILVGFMVLLFYVYVGTVIFESP